MVTRDLPRGAPGDPRVGGRRPDPTEHATARSRPGARTLAAALALACAPADPANPAFAPLSDVAWVSRASLDLRGVRPTLTELDRIPTDGAEAIVAEFLHDPRFPGRVADLAATWFRTRTESPAVNPLQYGVDLPASEVLGSVGEEPLQMLARITADDLSYAELVTGDWTMANEATAALWPIDRPEGEGWQVSRYRDGRPAAGALAGNSLWWRWGTTDSNANRGRANQISRIFLCHDHLLAEIEFDRSVDLLDGEAVQDALKTQPSCIACHQTLDPLASYLYGFWAYSNIALDTATYHPERELRWRDTTGVGPGFYGDDGGSLADLGRRVAADERYPRCFAERVVEGLLRQPVDRQEALRLREVFVTEDLRIRPLFEAVVTSPAYRGQLPDDDGGASAKLASPELVSSMIADLTGYRLMNQGFDQLRSEAAGYLTLAGGADGVAVITPADRPNTTMLLVHERLAEAAAEHVVAADLVDPARARLLIGVDPGATPDTPDRVRPTIVALHRRLFGRDVDPNGEEVAATLALWTDLWAVSPSADAAWRGVVSALLRDPDLVIY
jgi:hypothetical protein